MATRLTRSVALFGFFAVVLLLVLLCQSSKPTFAAGSAGAWTTHDGIRMYDSPVPARSGVSADASASEASFRVSGLREWSAFRASAIGRASTTPSAIFMATEAGTIYRTGSRTDGALTDATGLSFRDSISSSADGAQVFKPGDKIWAVDTAKLPAGSVVRDGVPAGHVSVNATPDAIRAAVFGDPFLLGSGMKQLEDGSYRLPK